MNGSTAHRFFGGSPLAVLVKLLLLSLVVGALLMWLDIEPYAIFATAERLLRRFWAMGFDAVRELGRYLVAGAVIVIPIWLLSRLFSVRGAR